MNIEERYTGVFFVNGEQQFSEIKGRSESHVCMQMRNFIKTNTSEGWIMKQKTIDFHITRAEDGHQMIVNWK